MALVNTRSLTITVVSTVLMVRFRVMVLSHPEALANVAVYVPVEVYIFPSAGQM